MTSSKRKKIPQKPQARLQALPTPPVATVSHVVAVPGTAYGLGGPGASAEGGDLTRRARVEVHRGGDVYLGLIEDELFETAPVSDLALSEMDEEDREEIEDEAADELLARFANAAGTPLDLPPAEALRVLTAVQRAVFALRSAWLMGKDAEDRRVDLLRSAGASQAPEDDEDGEDSED